MSEKIDRSQLFEFIKEAFLDDGLQTFCFKYFNEVYNGFASGQGLEARIRALLAYCEQHLKYQYLLEKLKEERPALFQKYEAKIFDSTTEKNNARIIIQSISQDKIALQYDNQSDEILNKLDALKSFLEKQQTQSFQIADKIYNIQDIHEANFDFTLGKANYKQSLPADIQEDLITDKIKWPESLRGELLNQQVTVGNKNLDVFEHYGWLIATFFQKMQTKPGKEQTLRRLSFMTEAYQSSLRYLCYIQMAQILQIKPCPRHQVFSDFIQLNQDSEQQFDYLDLLLVSTNILHQHNTQGFVKEMQGFVDRLSNPQSDVYNIALFLDDNRQKLLHNMLEEGDQTAQLLDEYLTAMVYWFRQIAFLANYRLVSIKEIAILYRLGSAKNFLHLYGELHGMYSQLESEEEDYNTQALIDIFTYNQSVLLFKGSNVETSLRSVIDQESYLSLSPLVIDQSVFTDRPTQTPEIYYYTGYSSDKRCYHFALYKNELTLGNAKIDHANKQLTVKAENNRQPKLNELFKQLDQLLSPLMP